MKKKFSLLLLAIFVFPVLALFGCDEVVTHGVTVYSSSETLGAVSGYGTYAEDTSVTLTATPKTAGRFVAWVYQGATEIADNEVYTIETSETKSTLTFTMNATTAGSYTAVFESKSQVQNNMMYIKLHSYRFVSNDSFIQTPEGIEVGNENIETGLTANLVVSHGKTSNVLNEVLNLENVELKDNVIYTPEDINQVLNLDAYTPRHLRVQVSGRIGTSLNTTIKDLRADIMFKQDDEAENPSYATNVVYNSNGTYTICFTFAQDEEIYHLILTYKNLTANVSNPA